MGSAWVARGSRPAFASLVRVRWFPCRPSRRFRRPRRCHRSRRAEMIGANEVVAPDAMLDGGGEVAVHGALDDGVGAEAVLGVAGAAAPVNGYLRKHNLGFRIPSWESAQLLGSLVEDVCGFSAFVDVNKRKPPTISKILIFHQILGGPIPDFPVGFSEIPRWIPGTPIQVYRNRSSVFL